MPSSSYSRYQVRAVSSSNNRTFATSPQLIPPSNNTSALARRASRCATEPSRARSIRSLRDSGSRKPARIEGLASFGYDGSTCRLSDAQQDKLRTWIAETLPRTTREVGVWIETECGVTYDSRSGLIALLHRLDMEHRCASRWPDGSRPGSVRSL